MRTTLVLLVVLAALLLRAAPARACDLCGCPVVIDGSSAFFDQGFSLGLSEQYTRYATLQLNGNAVPNPYGEHLNSSTTQLYANYNFDNRLGLQLNIPWIYRSWNRREGHHASTGQAAGLGDMSLVAHYLVIHKFKKSSSVTLNLQGGLKVPTGSPGFLAEELGDEHVSGGHAHPSGIHGHDLAFGSGSVDGMLGASFFLRQERFFFAANLQYSLRTRGAYGYQYANDFLWSAGPGIYLNQTAKSDLKLRLNFSGEVKGLDNLNGVASDDTGITTVFVGPQLIGNFGKGFYLQAGVDLPIVRDNTALQLMPDYRLNANANVRF